MKYTIEHYKNCERFNDQYPEIYAFLLDAEKEAFNEHFPCAQAKAQGAKRATVISDQDFYYRIGFTLSSEVYCWKKNI